MNVARDVAERGWWASYGDDMGARQALYADLEAGAAAIREFQPFVPGLAQTLEFAWWRQAADSEIGPVAFHSQRAVEARQTRQKMLGRPEGPTYEVVLDEIAVRRLPAPPEVLAAQLRHLVTLAERPKITVRVLPVDARIAGHVVPRSAFSLYTYPDPLDPQPLARAVRWGHGAARWAVSLWHSRVQRHIAVGDCVVVVGQVRFVGVW